MGIDLAWSPKNYSGIAILEGNKSKGVVTKAETVLSDQEILLNVMNLNSQPALIAIDSPLIVPNQVGRREAEKITGHLFRKYNAGAHPSNRVRLSQWSGTIRGEEITNQIVSLGITHSPHITQYEKTRKVFEVYPHPSMVVLFNLEKILRYKAKPKRDYALRYKEFQKFLELLSCLKNPSISLPEEITYTKIESLKAKQLKAFEDKLDAIFCAYIAYYAWCHPEKCAVLGSMEKGYIFTPIFPEMNAKLKELANQVSLKEFIAPKKDI